MTGFDELDDAAKVKYSQAELAATYDELTALSIHESVPGRLTHLGLEEKLNDLLARANVVAQDSWKGSR